MAIGGGGVAAKLYIDYAGYDNYGTVLPNNNYNIGFYVVVGTEDFSNQEACHWQRYDIKIDYFTTSGQHRIDTIGYLWIQHIKNRLYAPGYTLSGTTIRPNPAGSGNIYYFNGVTVATVYNDGNYDQLCSDGAHSHMEFVSLHAWGAQYEWHSTAGPDFFYQSNHTHGTSGANGWDPDSPDSASAGQVVAFIGGARVSRPTWDNPGAANH